ncbi:MAG: M23 family metallopeptidase, partial [Parcubacteria group bacterium]
EFDLGDPVNLQANPNCGWTFDHWDDGTLCYADNPWTVVMDGSKEVDAVFSPIVSTISVVPDTAQGSVYSNEELPFIHCDDSENSICSYGYSWDASVTLKAEPKPGYVFSHWEENGITVSTEREYCFLVEGSRELVPVFEEFRLGFPLMGYTPYDAPISSVFDHSATAQYDNDTDHHVTAFNGESSEDQGAYSGTTCYPKADNLAFLESVLSNYVGYGSAGEYYLCYDGHPGYDYVVSYVDVYSAAEGVVLGAGYDSCLGNNVTIQHKGGYKTRYFHLDSIDTNNVQLNQHIGPGIRIGMSGNTGTCSDGSHLHFQVEDENNEPIDPYGWSGTENDPYPIKNATLWQ